MIHPNIVLTPAVIAILYVLAMKVRQHKIADFTILLLCAIALLVNVHLVYDLIIGNLTVLPHLLQMAAGASILPLSYIYFSRQLKATAPLPTVNFTMWALAALTFIPLIVIYNPLEPFVIPDSGLHPYAFYVILHGQKIAAIYTGDLVVILQCLVLIYRMLALLCLMRQHNLHLNHKVYVMCGFWVIAAIMTVIFSSMTYAELRSTTGEIFYFCGYSLLLVIFNILIIKGYDDYQLETEQGEVVEDLDIYVKHQYSELASRMRHLMEEEKLYTDSQLTAERMTEMLHTNHTYFSQMMVAEWGMSFSDYLGGLRLQHVESLLNDQTLTISNVAQQSGFADAGYMTKKFKAKHGVTPTEWRRAQQNA